ncbi:hypothetical protein RND81_05G117000 [Saponaria officinalis]|uniref:G-box binding protein multifunctional mosaic region domain-containing protein n=1 Tax=Saponaria officinalis TaxID=3572 RepID=A0AAW1KVK9_SAPOF
MGSSETDKPAKEPKIPPSASAPEQGSATSTGTVNAEWSGYQAYPHIPPPGYMASTPQAHPYMWGVQHMIPSYGTPPHPYVAMYPHGGVYAHPSMPPGSYPFAPFAMPSPNGMVEASGNTHGSADADNKQPEGKEKLPVKRMRGSLGSLNMLTSKTNKEGSKRDADFRIILRNVDADDSDDVDAKSDEESDDDDDDEDDIKALLAELEQIKRERAEEMARKVKFE